MGCICRGMVKVIITVTVTVTVVVAVMGMSICEEVFVGECGFFVSFFYSDPR